ncbi:hypothetical protein ACFSSA_06180 [Luteolibacter algae]|uniref:Lipoprotein n=1 Tax=Luteolibacter algae TaxID=454151 RepID=A0ABW5D5C0_9BACT
MKFVHLSIVFPAVGLFSSCSPLNGADPLDGSDLAAAVSRNVPNTPEYRDEMKHQNERIERLSNDTDVSSSRKIIGLDQRAEF